MISKNYEIKEERHKIPLTSSDQVIFGKSFFYFYKLQNEMARLAVRSPSYIPDQSIQVNLTSNAQNLEAPNQKIIETNILNYGKNN